MRTDGRTDETKLTDVFRDDTRTRETCLSTTFRITSVCIVILLNALNVSASLQAGLFKESECICVKAQLIQRAQRHSDDGMSEFLKWNIL